MLDVSTLREMLGKKLLTPGSRRNAVGWAIKEKDYSQRRACALVGMASKTCRHVPARPDDSMLRSRLREMADARRRFGYLHLLLRREGVAVNHKKLFRLSREERLAVRRRGGRKRAIGTRAPMAVPKGPNQRWSVDFLHDVLADGRRFRIFAAVDDFTRECLALTVDTSISGVRVVHELGRIAELRGRPCTIVSDNGTELTSNAVLAWSEESGIEWHYIAPGSSTSSIHVTSGQLRPLRIRAQPALLRERSPGSD